MYAVITNTFYFLHLFEEALIYDLSLKYNAFVEFVIKAFIKFHKSD